MLFIEHRFLIFFAVVLSVHWMLRAPRSRKLWLLVVSYLFYAAWDWRFLSLIWGSTLVDYFVGRRLMNEERPGRRRAFLLVSMTANLGLLGVFKYAGFFVESAGNLLETLGFGASFGSLEIILPVGISFYTFQTMSYTIDVYRRKLQPTRNLLDLALFVGFFPQLVAGPIVRALDFMPQLRSNRRWADVDVRPALIIFVVGFIQKAVVADNAAIIADQYFGNPEAFAPGQAFLGVFAYSAQIYGDFAGYSNMAIGAAALLGYKLPKNFDFPYLAQNITVFWRKWHMSLSSWLRDYLYVSLGGNRGSKIFTYRNLMLTMLLGGLWHGASWRFVIWGGLHGLALIVHREWRRFRPEPVIPGVVGRIAGIAFTFFWVSLAWIFFRAQDTTTAFAALRGYLFLDGPGSLTLTAYEGAVGSLAVLGVLVAIGALHAVNERGLLRQWHRPSDWVFAAGLGLVIPFVLAFVPPDPAPFIYFQF